MVKIKVTVNLFFSDNCIVLLIKQFVQQIFYIYTVYFVKHIYCNFAKQLHEKDLFFTTFILKFNLFLIT